MEKTLILYLSSGGTLKGGTVGVGVHGYMYDISKEGKGTSSRPGTYVQATKGYVKSKENKEEIIKVSPISYIDIYKGFINSGKDIQLLHTLADVIRSFTTEDVKRLHIISDSKYIVGWVTKCIVNTINLKTITNNVHEIEGLKIVIDTVKSNGCKITIENMPVSNGNVGMDAAISLANAGIFNADKIGIDIFKEIVSDVNDGNYWSPDKLLPVYITGKRLYSIEGRTFDKNVYEMITYDEDHFLGVNKEAGYSIVRTDNKVPIIETLVNLTNGLLNGVYRPFLLHLDTIRTSKFAKYIKTMGLDMLKVTMNKNIRVMMDEVRPVVTEQRTDGIMPLVLEVLDDLHHTLDTYAGKKKDNTISFIDIKDYIVTTNAKDKQVLRPEITQQLNILNIPFEVDNKIIPIPVSLGTDICNRIALNSMSADIDTITLAVKKFKIRISYTTIIVLKDGTEIIWSSMNVNNIFVDTIKNKKFKTYVLKK